MFKNKNKWFFIEIAIVAVILALGAYIRFTGLTCLPPGLYPDEAMNTTDGLTTAEAGGWKLFYENNNGREGLYINILGYLLHWFGNSLWVVRFFPALIGTLTLPAVYWLGRRVSGRFGGIMALGLTAFSYWHLNFSRIGFRALLMVFMLSWAFAFLVEGFWRLVNTKKRTGLFFAISGMFFGLSLHTYIAVRIAPAAVGVLFLLALLFFTAFWKDILKNAFITVFFTALTAAPLVYDFILNPIHFTGRTSNVSVLNSPHLAEDLGKSIFLTLASFLAYGDQNWRHNYPWLPLVLPVWGIILFIGVGWGISRFIKEIGKKFAGKGAKDKKKNWETVVWIFLIAWWGFLLLPSIMTNEGLPHALRSIGAIPPTFLLAGLIISKWANLVGTQRAVFLRVIFSGLAILSAAISVYAYFFLWGRSPQAHDAFDFRTSGIGIYLRDTIPLSPKTNFYFITNQDSFRTDANLPVMVEPIRFYTWQLKDRLKYILPDEFQVEAIRRPARIFFIQHNARIIEEVFAVYPAAKLQTVKVGSGAERDDPAVFTSRDQECFLNTSIPVDYHFSYLEIP